MKEKWGRNKKRCREKDKAEQLLHLVVNTEKWGRKEEDREGESLVGIGVEQQARINPSTGPDPDTQNTHRQIQSLGITAQCYANKPLTNPRLREMNWSVCCEDPALSGLFYLLHTFYICASTYCSNSCGCMCVLFCCCMFKYSIFLISLLVFSHFMI